MNIYQRSNEISFSIYLQRFLISFELGKLTVPLILHNCASIESLYARYHFSINILLSINWVSLLLFWHFNQIFVFNKLTLNFGRYLWIHCQCWNIKYKSIKAERIAKENKQTLMWCCSPKFSKELIETLEIHCSSIVGCICVNNFVC